MKEDTKEHLRDMMENNLSIVNTKLKEMCSFAEALDDPLSVLRELLNMRKSANFIKSHIGWERIHDEEKEASNESK